MIVGVNSSSSTSWLQIYKGQYGIAYPFVFDSRNDLLKLYQVGSAFDNFPQSYFIVDKNGIVRFRTDDKFGQEQILSQKVAALLTE